jgi:oxygen-independent coproporphyrinogen-3 oxidase
MEKREKDIPRFVDMLIREIELNGENFHENWTFDTIFFGGGTPSLLEPRFLEQILNTLDRSFNISKAEEITMEANPGEAPRQRLAEYYKLGINRLSIGFQSLQPKFLTYLSRLHSPKDCFSTYRNARDAGFENINIDMIFNIPGQSLSVFQDDMKQVVKLDPEHISAYSLTVEKNTPLYTKVRDGIIIMPSGEMYLDMFEFCQKYLRSHSYSQYEISNYCKSGMECCHNLHYWNLEPCLAFGPSAHGYDGHIRWWNTSSLDAYIKILEHNEKPVSGSETLSQTDHFNEAVFNGLRTRGGIQLHKIHPWERDSKKMNPAILKWKDRLNITKDTISLKSDSYKYADEIASDMMITKPQ